MPPKNKGKKGKKQDDDEYWEKAGETIASQLEGVTLEEDEPSMASHSKKSDGFSAFSMLDNIADEGNEDFGGLMSTIKASSGKAKKDKKKAKKENVSFADGPGPGEGDSDEEAAAKGDLAKAKKPIEMTAEELAEEEWGAPTVTKKSKKTKKGKKTRTEEEEEEIEASPPADVPEAEKTAPVEMTAEEMADEEFGATKKKAKKAKKGKKGKAEEEEELEIPPPREPEVDKSAPVEMTAEEMADEEFGPAKKKGKKGKIADEEDSKAAPAPAPPQEPVEAEAGEPEEGDEGDGAGRVLTKKEKEKLKKEREKARKKAQAAAKKEAAAAVTDDAVPEPVSAPAPSPSQPTESKPDAGDDEDEEAGGDGAAASKKKKKKKPTKKEEPAPAAKKPTAGVSALKKMMEERKRLEEEARQKEEEERRRIEEEERKAAEEEKRKEEEKQRKKEREKAKRDLAKKEGRYLTKKQKEEKAAAEARKKALLESGVVVEGLQQHATGTGPKKVVYGKRQRKGPQTKSEVASSHADSVPASPKVAPQSTPPGTKDEDVKSDWDNESDDEAPPRPVSATPPPAAPPAATASPIIKPLRDPDVGDDVKSDWDDTSEDEEAATVPKKTTGTPIKPQANGMKAIPPAKPLPSKSTTVPTTPKSKANGSPAAKATSNATKIEQPKEDSEESEESGDDSEESSSEEDSDSDDTDSDDSDEMTAAQKAASQRKAEAAARREQRYKEAMAARSKDNLRSPICCILGHVDTGKTKLLDKIRQTNVQEGEAGGITQQIGATYFPVDAIKQKTAVLNTDGKQEYKIPGLLVIDTPGHESFTNLRSRGSSLCNIAILVVDIMHGLEPQTLESLRLLRDRKTPFIVALNKIDRMYGWVATPDNAFQDSLAKQTSHVKREFEDRLQKTMLAFSEQGLNAVPYYENKNFARNVSLVPTSAITGEGVPDMIMLLVNLTQQRMSDSLMYLSELECTVLEVKVIEGLGTTIDVVLSNGILREGDKIVLCGLNGPIVTQVRALLTPQPLRELRVKSAYVHHKEVKAALGVKIAAPDLEKAIAGSRLLVCGPDDDEDDLREEVMSDLTSLMDSIDKSGRGVCVQASTLGSLEALLEFLRTSKIPVSGINIGPVHKKDVMRSATMLEKAKELACILCFDVTVDKEAEKLAEELGIKLFKADIIYHLFDAFKAYNAEITEAKRRDQAPQAIWPCRLKTLKAFATRDPIILGVDILDGSLRVGTPLCVVKVDPSTQKREIIDLGRVTSLEINHKSMEVVKKSQVGAGVAVKIESAVYQSTKMFGRHFDEKDEIVSHITRASIDVLKATFKDDVSMEEWVLIKGLKPRLGIQ